MKKILFIIIAFMLSMTLVSQDTVYEFAPMRFFEGVAFNKIIQLGYGTDNISGALRYNSTLNEFQGFNGTEWISFGSDGIWVEDEDTAKYNSGYALVNGSAQAGMFIETSTSKYFIGVDDLSNDYYVIDIHSGNKPFEIQSGAPDNAFGIDGTRGIRIGDGDDPSGVDVIINHSTQPMIKFNSDIQDWDIGNIDHQFTIKNATSGAKVILVDPSADDTTVYIYPNYVYFDDGIRVGYTATVDSGMIRFYNGGFYGHNGTEWVPLDSPSDSYWSLSGGYIYPSDVDSVRTNILTVDTVLPWVITIDSYYDRYDTAYETFDRVSSPWYLLCVDDPYGYDFDSVIIFDSSPSSSWPDIIDGDSIRIGVVNYNFGSNDTSFVIRDVSSMNAMGDSLIIYTDNTSNIIEPCDPFADSCVLAIVYTIGFRDSLVPARDSVGMIVMDGGVEVTDSIMINTAIRSGAYFIMQDENGGTLTRMDTAGFGGGGIGYWYADDDSIKSYYHVVLDSSFKMRYGDTYLGYDPMDVGVDGVLMGIGELPDTASLITVTREGGVYTASMQASIEDSSASVTVSYTQSNEGDIMVDIRAEAPEYYSSIIVVPDSIYIRSDSINLHGNVQVFDSLKVNASEREAPHFAMIDINGTVTRMDTTGWRGGSVSGDTSLWYRELNDGGTIRNKLTDGVHIDTALMLSGLKANLSAFTRQKILIRDTVTDNIHEVRLSDIIDTAWIYNYLDDYWYSDNDSLRTNFHIRLDSTFRMVYGNAELGYTETGIGDVTEWVEMIFTGADTNALLQVGQNSVSRLVNAQSKMGNYSSSISVHAYDVAVTGALPAVTMVVSDLDKSESSNFTMYPDSIYMYVFDDGEVSSRIQLHPDSIMIKADTTYINSQVKISSPTELEGSHILMWDSSSNQLTVEDTTGWRGGTIIYEEQLTAPKTVFTVGFELTDNTLVMYNGHIIQSSQWSGVGTDTLTINLDTYTYDFLTVKQ